MKSKEEARLVRTRAKHVIYKIHEARERKKMEKVDKLVGHRPWYRLWKPFTYDEALQEVEGDYWSQSQWKHYAWRDLDLAEEIVSAVDALTSDVIYLDREELDLFGRWGV